MYRMLYNDSFLFDPFDETRIVSSASITTNVNAASYLDFTIAATHPLYDTIEQRSGIITLYSDNEKLFQGQITSIDMDMDGNKSVTCSSALDWLKDVQLRPYSTDQDECNEYEFKLDKAPDALDAYFQWLIDQYNAQNKDNRYFTINVNQAADLTNREIVYFASTSPRSVADAIEEDILKTFGGYLVLRYEDDQLILDLYSDIHEMNEQVIDYGENILDISRSESTDNQYTAVYPIGATPQYTAAQQKYHDEKDAYDEYMKQRDETEKAAIAKLKKEEEAEQKRINGIMDKNAKKAAQDALRRRKDQRQAREKAFSDKTKELQDAQKIKDDKNNADKTKPNPITIESLNNGGYPGDLDIFKEGDVVYSMSYVARYGYKEFVYSENDVHDKNELLMLAVAKLKTLMAPVLTIDVRAVDQALYNPKHRHLFAGQAVRVRSKAHNVDEFMMVSSIDLDLIDPSQTTATLGVEYDTLTGQQSSFLRNLNSQIVASVDAVDKLGENVKVTEITLGKVETVVENTNNKTDLIINTVDDYKWMTDTAWGKADDAQADADKANQGVTDTNIRIDNMETDISGINTEISNTKAEIVTIKENAEQIRQDAQAGIEAANQKAEDIRSEANTAIDKVKTDLAATEAKAQQAASNASAALGGLSSANTDITNLRTEVDRHTENITNINGEIVGVRDTISGVAETANSALSVATTNTHAINEQSTRIDTAYSDIEATRTSVSEVKQTADGLKVNLETNYLDKDALGANYASKAELTATSESITSTVSKTYATKSALEGLQNIADAAIETWSGRAVPTASNPPASTWTTDALKRQHSGDIYYDMTTGKSYRWGSANGTSYSWSMIADNDITKAIADSAKAQQTADGAKQDVVNLSDAVKAEYVSNSTFDQTAESIRASVTEAASTANAASEKAAALEVRANGIDATLREQASTLDNHTTTIGQLSVKADGLQGKFEQSVDMANLTNGRGDNFIVDPGFENAKYWNLNGSTLSVGKSGNSHTGSNCMRVAGSIKSSIPLVHPYGDTSESSKKMVSVIPGHRYRMSFWFKSSASCTVITDNNKLRISNTNDTVIEACDAFPVSTTYVQRTKDWVCPANITSVYLKWNMEITSGEYWIDDISFIDVTADAKGSEALTKTATLEAGLNGFKQTVAESYLKKDDAETKYTSKSEFTQTANEIKGTVAEQATTIDGHANSIATLSLKATKFETDISQVTEQATAIAGRTTKLEQDLGGFKQTVKGTYITKTDADKNLTDAINAMQIGGTNLLLDTLAFGNANPNNVSAPGLSLNSASQNGTYNQFTYRRIPDTVTTNNANGPQYSNIPIARGKTYTASFWYRGTADLIVYFYGDNGYVSCISTTGSNGFKSTNPGDGNITFAKNSEWKRYWVTWTLRATGGSHLNKHLLFRRKGTTGYIDIAGVKLEEGSKATEWSPSPFDTLYASNIEKTYAPKTMVQQTEDRITQTVEATYASKTQLTDEMKKSVKTLELRGRMDGNYWFKLGRLTMPQQGKDFHIDYTGGRGYNGDTGQNSQLEIHVRSGNGGGRLFAVTLNRLLNADMYQIKAFTIDSTHIDLYIKSGHQYSTGTMAYYGQYRDFSGAKQIDDISTAEGTELTVLEQSLSTKTYVEQKAESVAIGVVEEYKNGEHGDKLTTQSNLTVLKNEITTSVSKQYVSNDKLTEVQTDWKQTTDGFAASIKKTEQDISAVGGSMAVINGGFESGDSTGWAISGFASSSVTNDAILSNNTYKFVAMTNGKTIIMENEGRIPSSLGDYIKVSARILVLNSDNISVTCPCRIGIRSARNGVPYYRSMTIANNGWNIIETTIKTTIDGLQGFYLDFYGAPSGRKVVVDDVTMVNDTTAVALRTDLETRIAMTAKGVRVGKVVNNKFQGGNVLMNADDGSFDILNGDETRNRFTAESIDLAKNSDGNYQYRLIPFTQQKTGSVTTVIQGINMVSLGYFALNGIPATPATLTFGVNSGEGNSVPNNTYLKWDQGVLKDRFMVLHAKNHHDQFYADMDAGRVPDSYVFRYPVSLTNDSDGSTTVSKTAFMVTAPSMYMIQGQWNGRKPARGALCDVALMVRKYNSTTYGQMGYTYRFSESDDPIGWTTKGGPIWAVELDAGDRIAFMFKPRDGRYEIGSLNWFSITRLPFSGLDFRLINKQ